MTCKASCRLILVRHGQTEWNKQIRFQGIADIPLDDEGMRQAEFLSQRIASWPPDVIYTSPLNRAKSTAQIISRQFDIQPIIVPELIEVNFGIWEGVSIPQLEHDDPEAITRWKADPFFNVPEGGESWPEICERLSRAMNAIISAGHERVIVVAHGGVMRVLIAMILGIDPHKAWNVEASNCGMTGIEIVDDIARLYFANDDLHIRGGEYGVNMPIWGESYGQ